MTGGSSLEVVLYGQSIGHVRQDEYGRHSFLYAPDYGQDASKVPLSLSMPVGLQRYPRKRIVPFLEGLLPDSSDVRQRWADRLGVSPDNPFALLSHMGRDCAGSAEFRSPGATDAEPVVEIVGDDAIAQRLRAFTTDEAGWTVTGERWSLAGAQSKFTLSQRADGRWAEVRGAEPSTHIFKPGISDYRDQALVEHVSMSAAREVGLDAARTEYREFAGEPALVVTRFDRRRAKDGSVVRLHQEDMCQALAVYPRYKYEANRGPSAEDVALLLWSASTEPDTDVWRLAQALVFNYLIGAPDAHAKNYSVTHLPGRVRLAPLYDVASALPYDAQGDSEIDQAAMSIGGRRTFGTVHGRHWDRLADRLRADRERLRQEIRRQAAELPPAFDDQLANLNAQELRERLMPRLEHLCAATVTQLRD